MAILNSWQRLDRVLLGQQFGNGSAGTATISADPNTRATVTGTAATSTSTLGSAILSNGDVCVLHQTQGTGAGQWEIQKVLSGGGTTSITWITPLQYTYGTGAQCIKFNLNSVVTVNAHSIPAWNGTTGGVEVINGANSITVAQALTGTGLGFRGGNAIAQTGEGTPGVLGPAAYSGEGTVGASVQGTSANGNGGGGGQNRYGGNPHDGAGGGGGGHAVAGTTAADTGAPGGTGGGAVGEADLTITDLGGGGGGASVQSGGDASAGGAGGGIIILISKSVIITGSIVNAGANSGATAHGTGGGGAGGAILVVAGTVTLGSNLITALAGAAGTASNGVNGGDGSVGRIAVHHSGAVTGTTNPSYTDVIEKNQNAGVQIIG